MTRRKTKLKEKFSEEEMKTIELFKKRVIALIEARQKYEPIPVCVYETNDKGEWEKFSAKIPSDDDLLQLFTRFRFFYLQKEPTEFGKVFNIVRNKVTDTRAKSYLDWMNYWYKSVMNDTQITGNLKHPISNRKIIDYWFNSEYFHSDFRKLDELKLINDMAGEIASKFQLFLAVVKCSVWIINFFVVINITNNNHLFIYTPENDFKIN